MDLKLKGLLEELYLALRGIERALNVSGIDDQIDCKQVDKAQKRADRAERKKQKALAKEHRALVKKQREHKKDSKEKERKQLQVEEKGKSKLKKLDQHSKLQTSGCQCNN